MTLADGARVSGVFTQNRFCAAPVQVAREHLASGKTPRALLVNTGNANAGTGKIGIAGARASCEEAARLIRCDPRQVLPFSTGVIMEPLARRAHRRGSSGLRRRPARGQLGAGGRGDHDDRYGSKAPSRRSAYRRQ